MKLFVTDLDGTLYPKDMNNKKEIFESNKVAVYEWIKKGNKFAVATARGIGYYETICNQLGFKVNFLGGNGAENVFDTGEINLKSFPMKIYFDICEFIENLGIDASVSTIQNGNWFWNTTSKYPIYDSKKPRWQYARLADRNIISPSSSIERIAIFVREAEREEIKTILIGNFGKIVNITTSDIDTIDVGPINSSKGISILELAKKYNITPDNIVTIGDSENDVAMFKISKRSYCIDHAEPVVCNAAWRIVPTVADAIMNELRD